MTLSGELAALAAAAAWAVSTVLFRRLGTAIPPLPLNLCKGALAMPLLGAVLLLSPGARAGAELWGVGLLALSGVVGIGVGDTAFFAALNRLGERRTILMAETLAPPMTTGIALVVLSEWLGPVAVAGIVVTIAGVAWVVVERSAETRVDPRDARRGVLCGLLAAGCQAVGAVMSRAVLTQTEIDPWLSSFVRIGGGVAALLVWMPIAGQPYTPAALRSRRVWPGVVAATLVGTFVGLYFQQLSLQRVSAGVSQTLGATSTLRVLPIVALQGERLTVRACLGAAVAVAGVAMLVLTSGAAGE
ncbi:MAG: DMT family transporter [Planctomycetota bacterium]